VGRYSEFESLRKSGIRHADVTGYTYSREDVSAKSLADGYSQMLGTIFARELKPMEVELVVAQVGEVPPDDEIYRLSFDGSITGEGDFAVLGGDADRVNSALERAFSEVTGLGDSLGLCKQALEAGGNGTLGAADFEVALLDRTGTGRVFRRLGEAEVGGHLSG